MAKVELSGLTKVLDRLHSTVNDDSGVTCIEIWASRIRHHGLKLLLFCLGTGFINPPHHVGFGSGLPGTRRKIEGRECTPGPRA
jgi:hypothetical protein